MTPCSRCGLQPRQYGQRWCRSCRTADMRARRRRQAAARSICVLPDGLFDPELDTPDKHLDGRTPRQVIADYRRRQADWYRSRGKTPPLEAP